MLHQSCDGHEHAAERQQVGVEAVWAEQRDQGWRRGGRQEMEREISYGAGGHERQSKKDERLQAGESGQSAGTGVHGATVRPIHTLSQ